MPLITRILDPSRFNSTQLGADLYEACFGLPWQYLRELSGDLGAIYTNPDAGCKADWNTTAAPDVKDHFIDIAQRILDRWKEEGIIGE